MSISTALAIRALLTSRRCGGGGGGGAVLRRSLSSTRPNADTKATTAATSTVVDGRDTLRLLRLGGACRGVAALVMARPLGKNSFSRAQVSAVEAAIDYLNQPPQPPAEVDGNDDVGASRVVVLASAVKGVFCAGADLKERLTMTSEAEVASFVSRCRRLMRRLETLRQPTVAAIDGVALGGGLELALACDLRFASDAAKLGLVETRLAIIPGAGGTQRLTRLVGPSLAKQLMLAASVVDGRQARQMGIVNSPLEQPKDVGLDDETVVECVEKAVERDGGRPLSSDDWCRTDAFKQALSWAVKVAGNGPVAVEAAKTAVDVGGACGDVDAAMAVERLAYDRVIATADRLEGLRAFKEKRTPVYRGV